MAQYIDKSAVVAEIDDMLNIKEHTSHCDEDSFNSGRWKALTKIKDFLNTLEVKEVKEEPVNEDLEDYAKKESESFAEREYEIDYIDRNALAKGYYWGVKAGAQWQKQKNAIEVKEVDLDKEFDNYTKDILACDVQFEPFTHLYNCAKHFFELGLKTQKGE